jgi:hypothetical protein
MNLFDDSSELNFYNSSERFLSSENEENENLSDNENDENDENDNENDDENVNQKSFNACLASDGNNQIAEKWKGNHKNRLKKIIQFQVKIQDEGHVLNDAYRERKGTIFKGLNTRNQMSNISSNGYLMSNVTNTRNQMSNISNTGNQIVFEYHKLDEIDLIRKILLFLQGLVDLMTL